VAASILVNEIVDDLLPERPGAVDDVVLNAQMVGHETSVANGGRCVAGSCGKGIDLCPETQRESENLIALF
jgi:hypothetical protein